MSIDVKLLHRTTYRYSEPVQLGPQIIRLRPSPHCRSKIVAYHQSVQPADCWVNWQQDAFNNWLARVVYPEKTDCLDITIDLVARLEAYNPFDYFYEDYAREAPFQYAAEDLDDLGPYLRKGKLTPRLKAWVDSIDRTPRPTNDVLVELNQRLNRELRYLIRMEPGVQSPEETLDKGEGSCRDFAWLFVNLLRHLGFAARFVSGYSIQLKADVKALDGPSGVEEDICDLHAWAEVYLPGAGWVGMDATSGLFCGEGHLPLACTPEPRSAAPVTGSFNGPDGVETEFAFEMSVQRIYETPRVTLPYTEAQWKAIHALGEAVDEKLAAGDVRLTMGGEPTFVSIDDFESPQWTTDALGEHKRERAEDLLKRLFAHYGAGGFLHYGMGKWYPGEPLPRWAYACIWRKDGQAIWQNPALLADLRKDYGVNETHAAEFSRLLCAKLDVPPEHLMPGYEDAWYYMWKERRLPTNVNPLDNRLDDETERKRLAKVFEQGLKKTIGYVLPLERGWANGRYAWITGPWFLRPETLFLIPGDSPMGLRLPLDSLPWIAASDYRYLGEAPVPEDVPPLPDFEALAKQYRLGDPVSGAGGPGQPGHRPQRFDPWTDYMARYGGGRGQDGEPTWKIPPHMRLRPETLKPADSVPLEGVSAPWIVRTALCVEPREGNLFVFMPPVPSTEDYLDLLAAIEATAAELDLPVVIEGYLPPHDPRLEYIKVTPDPGVIEVNIHPSPNWAHLAEKTEFLYEAARQSRLATEKFDVDGGHTGTGGGNHIVIGAKTPLDSPFLRRPKLLSSLLAYWHSHPALSYLFSGKFIGPTSQAPRVDEARDDSLHELEIAMKELDRQLQMENCPAWLVDRIFRDILTDITGNTHRAEFCIDKLYSPDSLTGRLGLLEQRAFEMPPHWQMSLVQHVLLRALIARFWDEPYEPEHLPRWGTALHDQWMLPHFILQDVEDVCADLKCWGMPVEPEWFIPHLEFRFPKFGDISIAGVNLELRAALEPWHVMGEDAAIGGTARYVDSSVERLQVRVTGLTGDRFAVCVNGERLPLTNTGTQGEHVAGVRYRAWQPPRCLHPTIPVQAPLTIELVDTWNDTSLGGCLYHVKHPGGVGHDDFPVNALAAESRRLARFVPFGHTPGPKVLLPALRQSKDAPLTLDLRGPREDLKLRTPTQQGIREPLPSDYQPAPLTPPVLPNVPPQPKPLPGTLPAESNHTRTPPVEQPLQEFVLQKQAASPAPCALSLAPEAPAPMPHAEPLPPKAPVERHLTAADVEKIVDEKLEKINLPIKSTEMSAEGQNVSLSEPFRSLCEPFGSLNEPFGSLNEPFEATSETFCPADDPLSSKDKPFSSKSGAFAKQDKPLKTTAKMKARVASVLSSVRRKLRNWLLKEDDDTATTQNSKEP